MKKQIIPCFIACVVCMMSLAGEVCPEFFSLKIHNGKASWGYSEFSRVPVVKTAMLGNMLTVDTERELTGGKIDFRIPQEAKKIRLFDCEYDLPPATHEAYFYSVLLADIWQPWWKFQPDEMQRAMMLISVAPDGKSFEAQIWHYAHSGKKVWKSKKTYSCVITSDGQIFERLDAEERKRMGSLIRYWESDHFKNQDGKLQVRLQTAGRFYKYLTKKESLLYRIDLPKPAPQPYTLLYLNLPYKEKYLAENRQGNFKLKKSVSAFRSFAEKCRFLRCGMTPEETSELLGKPDDYRKDGAKGPGTKPHDYAVYYFLYAGVSSAENLEITLRFEHDPAGIPRLKDVY